MEGKVTPEIAAALKKLSEKHQVEATFESLQDAKVYPGEKVNLITSDYCKYTFTWAELSLSAKAGVKSPLPENALKQ